MRVMIRDTRPVLGINRLFICISMVLIGVDRLFIVFICIIILGTLSVVFLPVMTVYKIALPDDIQISKIDKVIYRFEANNLVPIGLISNRKNSFINVKGNAVLAVWLQSARVPMFNFRTDRSDPHPCY